MFLNVDNVGAERMSSGRLFQATGLATLNARLPSCSLVLGANKSPRAAERRAERLGTVETGMHSSLRKHRINYGSTTPSQHVLSSDFLRCRSHGMELASRLSPGLYSEYRQLQIGFENLSFRTAIRTICALEALHGALYKSTTTTILLLLLQMLQTSHI